MSRIADVDALPPPPPQTWADRRTLLLYRTAWSGVAAMPAALAVRLPAVLGGAWHDRAADAQRSLVRRHLSMLRPTADDDELDELTRAAYVSYARYWVEAFRLHRMDAADVSARCEPDRLDVIDEALAGGEGAIMATAHHGSWDIGALWSAHRGWPMTVVAEVLEPRRLFDRFVDLRRGAGIDVIPLVRGGNMLDRLTEKVQDGGLATLLADRDLTGKGPVVSFCGAPCRLPPGAAALARRTGRPVIVASFVTQGDGWRGVVHSDALDISSMSVEAGTQLIATELEGLLGRYPEQWHVFVRQWLADREPDHPAVAAWRRDPDGWLADPTWREAAAVDG